MNTPVYFVSDNHFQFTDYHNEQYRRELMFRLFSKIKETGGSLIIGGDFLDFWYDYGNTQIPGYESIFDALKNLNSNGVEIHYVLGNHDFWDFGYFRNKFGARVHPENFEFNVGKEKILVTHGDGLLTSDYGYRLMKKIIRHPISIFLFGLLRPQIGCKLASKVSKTSRHFNDGYHENEAVLRDIKEFAHSQFNENINTVLVGHYHRTGIDKYQENRLIWMGDWIKKFSVTIRDDKSWKQLNWEEAS